jgi:flavin-dependent thymidylate synthase
VSDEQWTSETAPEYQGKKEVVRWADEAMYKAEPTEKAEGGDIVPRVTLLYMTPDPLRKLASAARLYEGVVVHDPEEITVSMASRWFSDMSKTVLAMPLEWIDFHFLFEGVTRAWMDQLRTQRTAAYVAESLRFAVKEDAFAEVVMPPSITKLKWDDPKRVIWNQAVSTVGNAYNTLIDAGIPAEDARGLLPLNVATRIHYKTNLRNLVPHAGMRLCSQAQWEWKQVWAGMLMAIEDYGPHEDRWQQQEILRLFRPICYQTGRCQFRAETDRFCAIRERVEEHYANGDKPEQWLDINPWEAMTEGSARKAPSQ